MDYSNIYLWIREKIINASISIFGISRDEIDNILIEVPKDKSHGDLSTNAAMIIAKLNLYENFREHSNPLRESIDDFDTKQKFLGDGEEFHKIKKAITIPPRRIAELLIEELKNEPEIHSVEIAGPGFINITLKGSFWHSVLAHIIKEGENFGKSDIGKLEKVNIEFVSANPTGPMHIGHARGAIYGDALARVMEFSGYNITKEYYVNDAGSQILILTDSAHLRYREAFGEKIEIPEGYYPGEYLKTVAENIKKKFGNKFIVLNEELYSEFRKIVVNEMLMLIKNDLADLGIKHDIFFSEESMYKKGRDGNDTVTRTIEILTQKNLIYKGKLPAPKGEVDPEWDEREDQLLFKSSSFGDNQDRSLTKSDGSWTYFAGDIAYAKSKIDRGFKRNIIVLGADHAGYVKRLQAVYNALSEGDSSAEVVLSQMVNFIEDGNSVKMSKRAGKYATVSDVVREVGPDILRFIMLTRKNDIVLDFDLDLVKSQSKENPIFYVQYSYVRALSVIENARINHPEIYKLFIDNKYDLAMLKEQSEIDLIKILSFWVRVASSSATTYEVHRIAYYLQDLASKFHSFWNLGKEFTNYRFIIQDDIELSAVRLAIVSTVANVIKIGLKLLGVKPLEKM